MSTMPNPDQDITDRRGSLKFSSQQARHQYDIGRIHPEELFLSPSSELEITCTSAPGQEPMSQRESFRDTISTIVEGSNITQGPDLQSDKPILELGASSLDVAPETSTQSETREELVQRVKQEHADMGVVTVDELTGDVIAAAHDDHEMTEALMTKDYDEERALTIRIHE